MSLILIRQKERELRAKGRRQMLGALVAPVVVAFFYAYGIHQFAPLRMLHAPFALALAWTIAGLYFLNRGKWRNETPGDAGFSTGIEFCRKEIERQRDYLRRVLLWSFVPVLLAIATFVIALFIAVGSAVFPNAIPLMTLVVAWIGSYFLMRAWQQRQLQRELDELSQIKSENGR
ncbi:MAG TPA: hypothetical protein VN633_14075 [Bryobacteraceae bacterium]|nr:hypothetical protein [Bryobacteraceae bacterium]